MAIKVIINGANGRMGKEAVIAVENDAALTLVACAGRSDDLTALIKKYQADVVIDLTNADSVYQNTKTIIAAGAKPVIGTTGLKPEQVLEFAHLCKEKNLGGLIVPNFSIAAVLMMRYAADAARYFPDVEIIEMHHDGKLDAPSGTAVKTAQLIQETRQTIPTVKKEKELYPGARGANYEQIRIHSVRLPGLVAHQQVMFGNQAETLTIRHDTINRSCYMPGLLLACKKVMDLHELKYGLEHVL